MTTTVLAAQAQARYPELAARITRALALVHAGAVRRLRRPGRWAVRSAAGTVVYLVARTVVDGRGTYTCTCPDWQIRGTRWCKHVLAVRLAEGVDATVPAPVRETVQAVAELAAGGDDGVPVAAVARQLGLDTSAAWRRVQVALARLPPEPGDAAAAASATSAGRAAAGRAAAIAAPRAFARLPRGMTPPLLHCTHRGRRGTRRAPRRRWPPIRRRGRRPLRPGPTARTARRQFGSDQTVGRRAAGHWRTHRTRAMAVAGPSTWRATAWTRRRPRGGKPSDRAARPTRLPWHRPARARGRAQGVAAVRSQRGRAGAATGTAGGRDRLPPLAAAVHYLRKHALVGAAARRRLGGVCSLPSSCRHAAAASANWRTGGHRDQGRMPQARGAGGLAARAAGTAPGSRRGRRELGAVPGVGRARPAAASNAGAGSAIEEAALTRSPPLPDPAIAPWQRMAGEPIRWYARFTAYRLLEPRRSLLAAYQSARRAMVRNGPKPSDTLRLTSAPPA